MTEISAAMVKQLRDATSAGMMDCKRALQDTGGDFDAAVKQLREKGMASAAKRADRQTSEGRVVTAVGDGIEAGRQRVTPAEVAAQPEPQNGAAAEAAAEPAPASAPEPAAASAPAAEPEPASEPQPAAEPAAEAGPELEAKEDAE